MPKRVLTGRVTSDKQDKTVTVLVERRVMHPLYKKFIRRSKKYAAHDEANLCKEGDLVQILSGKDRGKQGRIIEARPRERRVLVENLNVVTRHTRPRPSTSPT